MNELTFEHKRAFLISSLITIGLTASLAWFVVGPETLMQLVGWTDDAPPASPITSDVREEGLAYVQTLPAYDQQQAPAVVFVQAQEAGHNVWILSYTSTGNVGGQDMRYDYNVFWQDGRLINHEVRTSDLAATVTVTSPEPGDILSDGSLTVQGLAYAGATVTVRMSDAENNADVFLETRQAAREDGTFTVVASPIPARVKQALLSVTVDDAEVRIPVFFDRGLYAAGN